MNTEPYTIDRVYEILWAFSRAELAMKAVPRMQRELEGRAAREAAALTWAQIQRLVGYIDTNQMSDTRRAQIQVNLDGLSPTLRSLATDHARDASRYGHNSMISQLQKMGRSVRFSAPQRNRAVQDLVQRVSTLTIERIKRDVDDVIRRGGSPEDVKRKLAQLSSRYSREIVEGARSLAEFEAARAANVSEVEWVDMQDERVRQNHRIGGERRPLGHRFSNGLLFPKEPGAPLDQTMGCRCRLRPVA